MFVHFQGIADTALAGRSLDANVSGDPVIPVVWAEDAAR